MRKATASNVRDDDRHDAIDERMLRQRLNTRCKCSEKRVGDTCFTPFKTGQLWDAFVVIRRSFAALHKLDQDQLAQLYIPRT